MIAQSGLNTPQYVLNQVILDPEEVLVVGGENRRDSWQEVPINQQHICHPIFSCEKWMLIKIQQEEGSDSIINYLQGIYE